jgi:hypothetical protein
VHAKDKPLEKQAYDTTNNVFSARDKPRHVRGVDGNHKERENERNTIS